MLPGQDNYQFIAFVFGGSASDVRQSIITNCMGERFKVPRSIFLLTDQRLADVHIMYEPGVGVRYVHGNTDIIVLMEKSESK